MFGSFNSAIVRQCLITHRKHVKRRLEYGLQVKRQFSSGNYSKLGDLYARLGLTANVSQDDIKKAYYELSKEHHPDRNEGCAVSTAKFRSVSEAYEILGNVSTRAQYDRETPYGKVRQQRRAQPRPQPSSAFSERDEDLAEKIRTYRENIRKRGRKPGDHEEFTFRRENVFDFDAWYRAHFHDDFDKKIRDERIKTYTRQYIEQMERISQRHGIRPPRPYVERKEPSDIEMQIMEMEEREIKKAFKNALMLAGCLLFAAMMMMYILDNSRENGPYEDLYAKSKQLTKTEKK